MDGAAMSQTITEAAEHSELQEAEEELESAEDEIETQEELKEEVIRRSKRGTIDNQRMEVVIMAGSKDLRPILFDSQEILVGTNGETVEEVSGGMLQTADDTVEHVKEIVHLIEGTQKSDEQDSQLTKEEDVSIEDIPEEVLKGFIKRLDSQDTVSYTHLTLPTIYSV